MAQLDSFVHTDYQSVAASSTVTVDTFAPSGETVRLFEIVVGYNTANSNSTLNVYRVTSGGNVRSVQDGTNFRPSYISVNTNRTSQEKYIEDIYITDSEGLRFRYHNADSSSGNFASWASGVVVK